MSKFSRKHYTFIAKTIGDLPVLSDQCVQVVVEEFGKAFEQDSELFDFKRFQSAVTREREGR